MQAIKRILLAGGGTAGHVNPALAIGSALATAETRRLYAQLLGPGGAYSLTRDIGARNHSSSPWPNPVYGTFIYRLGPI